MNKHINKQKGFTLIELLIVVAVIGILASVVLVGLGPIQKQGRDARRISDLRQIQNGLELYYNKVGSYPQDLNSLLISNGGVVPNLPKDPKTNNNYSYYTNGSSYCLGAQLEDLNNPNWARSISCPIGGSSSGLNCYSGSGAIQSSHLYCISL